MQTMFKHHFVPSDRLADENPYRSPLESNSGAQGKTDSLTKKFGALLLAAGAVLAAGDAYYTNKVIPKLSAEGSSPIGGVNANATVNGKPIGDLLATEEGTKQVKTHMALHPFSMEGGR